MQKIMRQKNGLFSVALMAIFFAAMTVGARPDGIPLPPPSAEKQKAIVVPKTEPKDWLAFVAYEGGYTFIENLAYQRSPHVMLFKDGRIIWRDDKRQGREMWRQSKISLGLLKTFMGNVEAAGFLTVEKTLPSNTKVNAEGQTIAFRVPHAGTTIVGVQTKKRKRIVSQYALGTYSGLEPDNRYVAAALATEKAIRALIPKESKRYEPSKIRVILFAHNSRSTEKYPVAAWPLAQKPDLKNDAHFFSGPEAETIIDALDKYSKVQIDGAVFTAVWAPAIAIPKSSAEKSKP